MFYERLLTPVDEEAPRRVLRLRELRLGDVADPEFDAFARDLAQVTGTPFAMVNFIDEQRQFFAGLYVAPGVEAVSGGGEPIEMGREMARDHGWCPHVVVRRLPLVLDDVCDYPRFAGNPVVDTIGIRSYMGAPLIDRCGVALGTICVVDREPRPWGRPGLELIKARAAEMVELIHRREDLATG
ncbi:histidine kinase [Actinomadura sp. NBRC 104425]|uniref:GAF domain-containing protein n=1 Tax=Actinomadura sp. NBRC 104425 TaxID=3032204 RepID=UPI0024A09F23|nr:GAF domain-containing protein [Actinomadura sp. NBRC 104425]GLZ10765.1 histidine kinase [Actinomadura sp. NBRC 104425]